MSIIDKIIGLLLIFTLLEVVVKTQTPKNGNTRDFMHNDGHNYQLTLNNFILEGDEALLQDERNLKQLIFHPNKINFMEVPVGDPMNIQVTLFNRHENQSVALGLISGKMPDFYSSFFEDKLIPPGGNTTFNVVFLPRQRGLIQSSLTIHTSFGLINYELKGEGIDCPYRLTPLVGLKAPFNATLQPEISMFNPHNTPLQIVEIFSSGGNLHLELPTGAQEGSQVLWEIPPYCTKKIIRLKYTATVPGNHTAYVRIKISGNIPSLADHVLIVPIEVEVLPETGIYTPLSFFDFGFVGANDKPIRYITEIKHSGLNQDFADSDLNVEGTDLLKDSFKLSMDINENLVINADWSYFTASQYVNGNILINATDSSYKLPFVVHIIIGGIEYSETSTMFLTSSSNYNTKTINDFTLKNSFMDPIIITNITVPENFESYFLLSSLNYKNFPITIKPGDSKNLFKISESKYLKTYEPHKLIQPINIHTNLSNYEIPVIKTNSLLRKIFPLEDGIVYTDAPYNFGTLPVSTSGDLLIALVNDNGFPIKVQNWKGVVSGQAAITIMLKGCSYFTLLNLSLCNTIKPYSWMLFHISVKSNVVGQFTGKLTVQTNFEDIVTSVKFSVAMGRLELNTDLLSFTDCFPDTQCNINLIAHSTFLKKLKVEKILPDNDGVMHTLTTNEVSPNVITNIGTISLRTRYFCNETNDCYTGLKLTNEDSVSLAWKQTLVDSTNPKLDYALLLSRFELYEKLKNSIKTISFRLITNQIKKFTFNTTVNFVWPKFIHENIQFPVLQIGHEVIKFITVTNPSDQLVLLQHVLHDEKIYGSDKYFPERIINNCSNCSISSNASEVFSFPTEKQGKYNDYVLPKSSVKIALIFSAKIPGTYSTLLYIRNNLTVVEGVWITAKAVLPQFKFANRKPGSQTALLFEISDKNLRYCDRNLSESDSETDQFVPFKPLTAKRTFTARNTGEVPIIINAIKVGGRLCEGYGFKVLDCSPFELTPNSSKKIEIAFTPDFTLARVTHILEIETSMGSPMNYTLLSIIPPHALKSCGKALMRPEWEYKLKIFSAIVLTFVLFVVLIGAFLDSDRVLKDHLNNLSRDRGAIQPTLDLRQIGLKRTYINETISLNNSSETSNKVENWSNKKKICIKKTQNISNIEERDSWSSIANLQTTKETTPKKETRSCWTQELSNKLSAVKNHVTESIISTTSKVISTGNCENSSKQTIEKNNRAPVNKTQIQQNKDLPKITNNRDTTQSEEETCSTTTEESLFNSEESLSLSSSSLSDGKSSSSSSTSSLSAQINLSEFKTDSNIDKSHEIPISKITIKKTRSLPHNYEAKDANETSNTKPKLTKQNISNQNLNNINKTTCRNSASSPNSSSDSNCGATNAKLNQSCDNSCDLKKINRSQRRGGKTPGRERKAQFNSKKSTSKIPSPFKGTVIDFNSTTTYPPKTSSMWDENRASFSYVVAQNQINSAINPDPAVPPNYNAKRSKNNSAAVVRQCLLGELNRTKNNDITTSSIDDECFGELIEESRTSIDLGPIGTRKSPSSTPVWEPMAPVSIKRPTPLPQPSLNSNSFFSNTFPNSTQICNLNAYYENKRNAHFATNTRSPTNNNSTNSWESSAMLLPLFQNEESDNSPLNGWGSNGLWAPPNYSSSLSGWPQTCGPLRPPPGLTLVRERNQDVQPNQNETRFNNLPQFDPFNSLSSIWPPESWNSGGSDSSNKNNKTQQQ